MTTEGLVASLTAFYAQARVATIKAAIEFEFETGASTILTSTDTALSFNKFFSWVLVFLALYVLFALIWKLLPATGLSKGKLPFIASSRCIGTAHCFLVVPLSIIALNQRTTSWLDLEYLELNSALESRVLELSVGYFVADFVHFVLFEPDLLMFFHHVFSIAMMASAGLAGRGAACATSALVQGEITNPFQSAWTVAKAAKAQGLLNWLSPLFTVVFVLVRIPIVPFWTALINYNLWTSPNMHLMPRGLITAWSVMAFFMAAGGWVWSAALIKGLRKFYAKKGDDKKTTKKAQ